MTLDDLILLEKSATQAPWEYDGMHNEIQTPHEDKYWLIVSECRTAPDQEYDEDQFGHHYDANFALIAALRNAAPALLRLANTVRSVVNETNEYEAKQKEWDDRDFWSDQRIRIEAALKECGLCSDA